MAEITATNALGEALSALTVRAGLSNRGWLANTVPSGAFGPVPVQRVGLPPIGTLTGRPGEAQLSPGQYTSCILCPSRIAQPASPTPPITYTYRRGEPLYAYNGQNVPELPGGGDEFEELVSLNTLFTRGQFNEFSIAGDLGPFSQIWLMGFMLRDLTVPRPGLNDSLVSYVETIVLLTPIGFVDPQSGLALTLPPPPP
jgi:hypothetical protein